MKKVLILVLSLVIFGCASPVRIENVTVDNTVRLDFDDHLSGSIAVTYINGGSDTNPSWSAGLTGREFKLALKESLKSFYLLAVESKPSYELSASFMKTDYPAFGSDLYFRTDIRYVLVNQKTDKVFLDEVVSSSSTTTISDAFLAAERLKIASERSMKKNIEKFLKVLESTSL
jgi:hypothetical protein